MFNPDAFRMAETECYMIESYIVRGFVFDGSLTEYIIMGLSMRKLDFVKGADPAPRL